MPAFLKFKWQKEYLKFTGKDKDKIKIIDSAKSFREFDPNKHHAAIVSYSMIGKYPALFKHCSALIADEVHYLCNMEAKRTLIFHHYVEKYTPEYLILLTGTPIKNRVKEFYSLLKLTDYGGNKDDLLKRFKTDIDFAEYFSIPTTKKFYVNKRLVSSTTYSGYRNLSELKEIMASRVIRRTEVEDLNIPAIQIRNIPCYKSTSNTLALEYDKYKELVSKSITSAKVDSAVRKTPITAKYIENLLVSDEGPIVVFSDHTKPLDIIGEKLKKYRVARIDGKVSMKKRDEIEDDFQEGLYDVLLLTIGAGCEGFTFTASNNMVLNDLSWSPSKNEQAIKRINRISATKISNIHMMIGDHLDERMSESLEEKINTINAVLA